MKILKLSATDPGKFGSRRVRHRSEESGEKQKQLNLFTTGRVLTLHSMAPFEEALILDEKGEVAAAKRLYQRAIEQGDQPANACCNLGILLAQEGELVKAISMLTQSLKHDPRHLEAHFNLANLYVDAGNLELGKLHYQISLEIDPGFLNSYYNLGLALAEAGDYEEAVSVLSEYCRLTAMEERGPVQELIAKLRHMSAC